MSGGNLLKQALSSSVRNGISNREGQKMRRTPIAALYPYTINEVERKEQAGQCLRPFFFFMPSSIAPDAWTFRARSPLVFRYRISSIVPTVLPPTSRRGSSGWPVNRCKSGLRTFSSASGNNEVIRVDEGNVNKETHVCPRLQ